MSLQAYEGAVHQLLQQPLARLGFAEKRRLGFMRGGPEAIEILSFPGRFDSGHFFFACTVGVHFTAIERVLRPDSTHEIIPTIFVPIHLLHRDRAFFEWSLYEPTPSEELAIAVIAELEKHALPFLEKYSILGNVRMSLESPDPADWFVLNPEQRISILAAIFHSSGATQQAIETVEKALAERQGALPKKRRSLEKLRTHLLGQQRQTAQ